jgi:ribosomal protein L37AE/L43A
MYWWYFLILFGAVAYFGYRRYLEDKRKKQANMPRCNKCGSIMELHSKQGDSEVWVCPKCSPKS